MNLKSDRSTWTHVQLGDVIRRSRVQVDPFAADLEHYVGGNHVDSESVVISRRGDVSDGQIGSTFRYVFEPGEVLFVSARPYLRKVGVPDFGGVVADKTYVLSAQPDGDLVHELLPFLLTSDRFIDYANREATGSMNPRLLWGAMQRYECALPPRDEQVRIASLLWAIEHCAQAVKMVAQSAAEVSEALRTEFLNTCGNPVKASDAFSITIGRQRSPKHEAGDYLVPYLRSANVTSTGVSLADIKSMNFTPAEQSKFALEPGDVLVSEGSASATAVGMPAVWNGEMVGTVCFQNTLLRYRAVKGVTLPEFVEQWCRWAFETGQFLRTSSGTNIHHIGSGGAAAMEVRLPSIEEQQAFVGRVTLAETAATDALIEVKSLSAMRKTLLAEVFGDS